METELNETIIHHYGIKYIRNWRLWKKIWKKLKKLDLRVCWVKGHAESKYNKRCDFVACAEATLGAMAY